VTAVLGVIAASIAASAGEAEPGSELSAAGYRVVADTAAGEEASAVSSELRIAVIPRPGWHLAPQAPARLSLGEHDRAELLGSSEERIEFRCDAPKPGMVVHARLKFGICRGDETACEIVRREFDVGWSAGAPQLDPTDSLEVSADPSGQPPIP
jgi:hypothetical protein